MSLLRIHEFNICDVDIELEGTLRWPHLEDEEIASHIDGTVVIYSISDASSTKLIPSFLRESNAPSVFAVLVRTPLSA